MNFITKILKGSSLINKIILYLVVGYAYLWIIIPLLFSGSTFTKIFIVFWILGSIIITIVAYIKEEDAVKDSIEKFKNDNIFFRYGSSIRRITLPVEINNNWETIDVKNLTKDLEESLITNMEEKINNHLEREEAPIHTIYAQDFNPPKDKKEFIKFSFTGKRGAMMTHFVHFQPVGKFMTLRYETYRKGIFDWGHFIRFILLSPFTILLWISAYLNSTYSLRVEMCPSIDNSFEFMDIRAYSVASNRVILDSIKDVLKEKGLLSTELEYTINNYITNNNSIDINGKGDITVGDIKQMAA